VAPWWLRWLHRIVTTVRGWDGTVTWFLLLNRLQKQGMAEGVIADFSDHIYHGKDLSDKRSVGGLNQSEVDLTVRLITACAAHAEDGERQGDE
jgi:hypothetical protein